jgi:hypothetical protein
MSFRRSVLLPALAALVWLPAAPLAAAAMSLSARPGGDAGPLVLIETAPLRSMMGEWGGRLEVRVSPVLAVAASYDPLTRPSEAAGERDFSRKIGGELLWYPLGFSNFPVFLGGGVRHEEATIHRERRSDAISGVPMTASTTYDRWTNEDRYLSLTQAVGYRIFSGAFGPTALTASLRFTMDELLHKDSTATDETIHSLRGDLDSDGRAARTTQILLHAGISFQ